MIVNHSRRSGTCCSKIRCLCSSGVAATVRRSGPTAAGPAAVTRDGFNAARERLTIEDPAPYTGSRSPASTKRNRYRQGHLRDGGAELGSVGSLRTRHTASSRVAVSPVSSRRVYRGIVENSVLEMAVVVAVGSRMRTVLAPLPPTRIPARSAQLLAGLVLYGVSISLMVIGRHGLVPWTRPRPGTGEPDLDRRSARGRSSLGSSACCRASRCGSCPGSARRQRRSDWLDDGRRARVHAACARRRCALGVLARRHPRERRRDRPLFMTSRPGRVSAWSM